MHEIEFLFQVMMCPMMTIKSATSLLCKPGNFHTQTAHKSKKSKKLKKGAKGGA
jgi:hypothetical protein